MAAVRRDAVDGALVTFQLPQSPQCVCVPQLEHAASAAAQQGRRPGDDTQRTNPVTVSVRDLLLLERLKVLIKCCVSSNEKFFFNLTQTDSHSAEQINRSCLNVC